MLALNRYDFSILKRYCARCGHANASLCSLARSLWAVACNPHAIIMVRRGCRVYRKASFACPLDAAPECLRTSALGQVGRSEGLRAAPAYVRAQEAQQLWAALCTSHVPLYRQHARVNAVPYASKRSSKRQAAGMQDKACCRNEQHRIPSPCNLLTKKKKKKKTSEP